MFSEYERASTHTRCQSVSACNLAATYLGHRFVYPPRLASIASVMQLRIPPVKPRAVPDLTPGVTGDQLLEIRGETIHARDGGVDVPV